MPPLGWKKDRPETEVQPGELTDEQLGIGEEDDNPMAILATNPEVAALIDAAVAARMAQLGDTLPAVSNDGGMLAQLVAGIERLVTINTAQQPGYSKPLPAEEVERRAAGFVEMNALINHYKEIGQAPQYELVGEPLYAGEVLYDPGAVIETWLYPNEHMAPKNEPATRVHRAMMQWIGGPQEGIAERVMKAEAERRGSPIPESPFAPPGWAGQSPVQVVSQPETAKPIDPRRPLMPQQPFRV